MRTFANQVIVLSGASDGIGLELALALGSEGARVALLARRKKRLQLIARKVRESGGRALVLPTDVTEREAVVQAVAAVMKRWGRIDMVVANAGIGIIKKAEELTYQDIQTTIEVNLMGAINLIWECIPIFLSQGSGRVVATGSMAAYRGLPTSAPYSASKAALHAFMESLRVELAPKGIRFTTVAPGFVDTYLTSNNQFFMPFLMSPQKAAKIILQGIKQGKSEIRFPLPMSLIMETARYLPNPVYDSLARIISTY